MMLGIVLIGIAQLFAELSTSLGKYEYERKRESLYAFGFLNAFWATIFLLALALYRDAFVFSFESLPTFALRAVFEVALLFANLHAVLAADRSTFAFLRTLTIPLLLAVDIALGYTITLPQMAGIALMVGAFVLLTLNHGLSRRGKFLTLLSALIPVITISLYKYNITHYNSVEAEQALQHIILLVVLLGVAWVRTGENLMTQIFRRDHLTQSLAAGAASVFLSYAYLFAPASIIMAGKRAFEIIGAILSGHAMFKEKHVVLKFTSCAIIMAGIGLMVV